MIDKSSTTEGRLSWRKLEPFGIELDFDLQHPMKNDEVERFAELFFQFSLVLLRNQNLSHDKHLEIAGYLGPVVHARDGIGVLSTDPEEGRRGTQEFSYHSDYSFAPEPLTAISLYATDVAYRSSSTKFVSAVHAYQNLPNALKEKVLSLKADLVAPKVEAFSVRGYNIPKKEALFSEVRPVVKNHPVTGKPYLVVNEMHAAGIHGLPQGEGKTILETLFDDYLYIEDNLYEHRWETGDIIFFDNLALQHARGDLSDVGRRSLSRICVGTSLYKMYPELDLTY